MPLQRRNGSGGLHKVSLSSTLVPPHPPPSPIPPTKSLQWPLSCQENVFVFGLSVAQLVRSPGHYHHQHRFGCHLLSHNRLFLIHAIASNTSRQQESRRFVRSASSSSSIPAPSTAQPITKIFLCPCLSLSVMTNLSVHFISSSSFVFIAI